MGEKQRIFGERMSKNKESDNNVGKVYRGNTKYIDKEPKQQRNYVVVVDDGEHVTVSKLKSIKIFDSNGKNADKALVEINAGRYGLEKRTGVDKERFSKNRMSGKRLSVTDKKVFPEGKERFQLGSHDKHRVLQHMQKNKGGQSARRNKSGTGKGSRKDKGRNGKPPTNRKTD